LFFIQNSCVGCFRVLSEDDFEALHVERGFFLLFAEIHKINHLSETF